MPKENSKKSKQSSSFYRENAVEQQQEFEKATQTDFKSEFGSERENSVKSIERSVVTHENAIEQQQELEKAIETDMTDEGDADVSESNDGESSDGTESTFVNAAEQQQAFEKATGTSMKVKPCGELDISVSSERGKMLISGCTYMPDGHVVLCDSYQDKIWLSNSDLKIKAGMDLRAKPWDAAVVDDKHIIVTLYNKQQLQFIQVLAYFKKGRTIPTGKPCYGVDVAGGLIYVTCYSIANDGEIKVYNLNGKLKRRIGVGLGGIYSFRQPYNVALQKAKVNAPGDFFDIYVSDFASNIITCLTAEGSFRYQYKYLDLDGPLGLDVKQDQRQFVCGWRSHSVIVADETKYKTLLTWKNGLYKPYCVAYSETERKLIVCCLNKLFVFHILDV